MVNAKAEDGTNCCVWALSQYAIKRNSQSIEADASIRPIAGRKPVVQIVRPLSDENSRLVNQRGLFTRGPNNIDLEKWIRPYYSGDDSWNLIKIVIPKPGTEHRC
jgi:hypothetical protein